MCRGPLGWSQSPRVLGVFRTRRVWALGEGERTRFEGPARYLADLTCSAVTGKWTKLASQLRRASSQHREREAVVSRGPLLSFPERGPKDSG